MSSLEDQLDAKRRGLVWADWLCLAWLFFFAAWAAVIDSPWLFPGVLLTTTQGGLMGFSYAVARELRAIDEEIQYLRAQLRTIRGKE